MLSKKIPAKTPKRYQEIVRLWETAGTFLRDFTDIFREFIFLRRCTEHHIVLKTHGNTWNIYL